MKTRLWRLVKQQLPAVPGTNWIPSVWVIRYLSQGEGRPDPEKVLANYPKRFDGSDWRVYRRQDS